MALGMSGGDPLGCAIQVEISDIPNLRNEADAKFGPDHSGLSNARDRAPFIRATP